LTDMTSMIGAAAALLSTTSFAPQAWKVIKTRDTEAISRKTYVLTVVGFALWTCYGALRADFPLVVCNTICLVLSGFILAMKILLPSRSEHGSTDRIQASERR
jgi:MtN3 and saliva related transmembrane protein